MRQLLPLSALCMLACLAGASCRTATPHAKGASEQVQQMARERGEARALFEEALSVEGEPGEQEKLYLRALEVYPGYAEAQNNLGVLYLEQEDYPDAVRLLREAVKSAPGEAGPRFNLGLAYEQIGRLGDAEEQYRAAAELCPDEPDYLESLARVVMKRNRDLPEARRLLKRALGLESRPEHVEWIRERLEALRAGLLPRLPRK